MTTFQLNDQQLLSKVKQTAKQSGQTLTAVIEDALREFFTQQEAFKSPQLESEKIILGLAEPEQEYANAYEAMMAWREKYVDENWDFDPDEVFGGLRVQTSGREGNPWE